MNRSSSRPMLATMLHRSLQIHGKEAFIRGVPSFALPGVMRAKSRATERPSPIGQRRYSCRSDECNPGSRSTLLGSRVECTHLKQALHLVRRARQSRRQPCPDILVHVRQDGFAGMVLIRQSQGDARELGCEGVDRGILCGIGEANEQPNGYAPHRRIELRRPGAVTSESPARS